MNFWSDRYLTWAVLPTHESKLLSSMLNITLIRLNYDEFISPRRLSTIYRIIGGLCYGKNTLGMIILIEEVCFSICGLISKGHIHLGLNLLKPIFWILLNCCFQIVYRGMFCEHHCCLSCKDHPNSELSTKHSEAIDQLELGLMVHRDTQGEGC